MESTYSLKSLIMFIVALLFFLYNLLVTAWDYVQGFDEVHAKHAVIIV